MYAAYQQQGPVLDEATALGILNHLDNATLQGLLEDDSKMNDLIKDLPQVKNLDTEKQTLLTSNKSLAEYNLSLEPRLHAGRRQLGTAYEDGIKLQKEYDQQKQKLDLQAAEQSLDTTLCLLEAEMATSEEKSEATADKFTDGDIEVEDFIREFIDERKEAHLRRVKAEKMKELLTERESQRQRAAQYSANQVYNTGTLYQNSWPAAPYPAANGPGHQPMPQMYYPR